MKPIKIMGNILDDEYIYTRLLIYQKALLDYKRARCRWKWIMSWFWDNEDWKDCLPGGYCHYFYTTLGRYHWNKKPFPELYMQKPESVIDNSTPWFSLGPDGLDKRIQALEATIRYTKNKLKETSRLDYKNSK